MTLSGCDYSQNNSSSIGESIHSSSDIQSSESSTNNEPTTIPTPEPIILKYEQVGITSGNLHNQSKSVIDDTGRLFVSLYDLENLPNEALYLMEGNAEIKRLTGEYFLSMNLVDDKLYYVLTDKPGFHVMDINTLKEADYASTETISEMLIIDDWVFFKQYGEYDLWAMHVDGSGIREITDFPCTDFYVYKDRVYCCDYDSDFLYSVAFDGTDKRLIYGKEILNFNISDDWIYFSEKPDYELPVDTVEHVLGKMKIDGTQKTVICDDYATSINVSGDWIYYSNRSANGELYKIKTDGTQRAQVDTEYDIFNITVLNDRIIYFSDVEEDYIVFTIKTDGTEKKILRYYHWYYTSP